MKLSKQERIGVLIIAVVLIIGLGIWLYIVPKVQNVSTSIVTLESKNQELQAAIEKANTKDELKDQVIAAYKAGQNLADMFFEEMKPYEADAEFRAFLDQCDTNVFVDSFSVTPASVASLAPRYFVEDEVIYPLKTYVTQDIEPTEAELATQARWQAISDALGISQEVGSISVQFEVFALSPEEIMAFCDEVNEYIKEENGNQTRKAAMISGMSITYVENEKMYDELIKEIKAEATDKALDALYKENNAKRPVGDAANNTQDPEAGENVEEEAGYKVSDYIYSLGATITFYSVERMQDPTPQLDAQEE